MKGYWSSTKSSVLLIGVLTYSTPFSIASNHNGSNAECTTALKTICCEVLTIHYVQVPYVVHKGSECNKNVAAP